MICEEYTKTVGFRLPASGGAIFPLAFVIRSQSIERNQSERPCFFNSSVKYHPQCAHKQKNKIDVCNDQTGGDLQVQSLINVSVTDWHGTLGNFLHDVERQLLR